MADVIIKVRKKEIRLSEDEARRLHAELDRLFGGPRILGPLAPFPDPGYPPQPFVYPSPSTVPTPGWPTITCEALHAD